MIKWLVQTGLKPTTFLRNVETQTRNGYWYKALWGEKSTGESYPNVSDQWELPTVKGVRRKSPGSNAE